MWIPEYLKYPEVIYLPSRLKQVLRRLSLVHIRETLLSKQSEVSLLLHVIFHSWIHGWLKGGSISKRSTEWQFKCGLYVNQHPNQLVLSLDSVGGITWQKHLNPSNNCFCESTGPSFKFVFLSIYNLKTGRILHFTHFMSHKTHGFKWFKIWYVGPPALGDHPVLTLEASKSIITIASTSNVSWWFVNSWWTHTVNTNAQLFTKRNSSERCERCESENGWPAHFLRTIQWQSHDTCGSTSFSRSRSHLWFKAALSASMPGNENLNAPAYRKGTERINSIQLPQISFVDLCGSGNWWVPCFEDCCYSSRWWTHFLPKWGT